MAMPATPQRWNAQMLYALPDDDLRHEIIDGEHIVTPAPRLGHQYVVVELLSVLRAYLRAHEIGIVLTAPADVELSDDTVVEPDLFVIPPVKGPLPVRWTEPDALLLVIEVTSPSTASRDRVRKRLRYQKAGIREYWIVDADARLIERWRPNEDRPEIATDTLIWQPAPDSPALPIVVNEIFEQQIADND
jgi:Uma2 family endonuclease